MCAHHVNELAPPLLPLLCSRGANAGWFHHSRHSLLDGLNMESYKPNVSGLVVVQTGLCSQVAFKKRLLSDLRSSLT